jgi:glycosyltransferase involved in cell wall biosynthesis
MSGTSTVRGTREVSVVVPLYNRASLIGYTLSSLLPDHHPGVRLQVIVVDDGSTDSGAEVAKRVYPWADVLCLPHRGAGAARNAGLERVETDAVLFLDSDDLVESGFFLPRLDALASDAAAAGAYGPFDFFEGHGVFEEALVRPRHMAYPIETTTSNRSHLVRVLGGWYVVGPATLWRASIIRDVGGYDEALRVNQDVDLLFRVLISTQGIIGCLAPRALCRDHAVGDRQGALRGDPRKATDLLTLRQRFLTELTRTGLDAADVREALARYCFDRWFEFRVSIPDIAEEFYALSRSLYPRLRLQGRWPLRALASALGARRAMLLARTLRRRSWRD